MYDHDAEVFLAQAPAAAAWPTAQRNMGKEFPSVLLPLMAALDHCLSV
jgi:hypothetical protein